MLTHLSRRAMFSATPAVIFFHNIAHVRLSLSSSTRRRYQRYQPVEGRVRSRVTAPSNASPLRNAPVPTATSTSPGPRDAPPRQSRRQHRGGAEEGGRAGRSSPPPSETFLDRTGHDRAQLPAEVEHLRSRER